MRAPGQGLAAAAAAVLILLIFAPEFAAAADPLVQDLQGSLD